MKKSAVIILCCISLIIASSSFALEAMTDSNMKNTRGQAGVDVELDNIEIEEARWEMYYVDDDGITGTPADVGGVSIDATIGMKTVLAVLDHTDRDGYLKREYGSFMRREEPRIAAAYEDWKAEDLAVNIASLDEWMETFPDDVAAAVLASGGDIESAPITIDVVRKLELMSSIDAFNKRNEGLATARNFYEDFGALGIDFSGDETANISAIMNATGMTEEEARKAYFAASLYATDQNAPDSAYGINNIKGVGAQVALQNISYDGVVAKLPTIEIHKTGDTKTIGIVADSSVNAGKEFIRMVTTSSTMTILGGTVEVTASH